MREERKRRVRINRWIRAEEVRVVGPDSKQIGVMPLNRALFIARDLGLDLVEIAPQAKPPVCRIIDFGRYKYEQQKREKEQKKKQKSKQMKEIVFRPSIEKHDFEVKLKHIKKFLQDGHKTKVTVKFRRAEMAYKEKGNQILSTVEKEVEGIGKIAKPSRMLGRHLVMILAPTEVKKNAQNKDQEIGS